MCTNTDTTAAETDESRMHAYVQAGDERAFAALFSRYAPMLLRYFVRRGKRPQDAHDLVQQTFLQIHRSRTDYRPGEPLRPWFFTIARNVGCDHGRRHQRRPETLCDVDSYQAQVTNESALHSERVRALACALDRLPGECRKLLNEHWFEDRSWVDIATRDGSHPGTLRVRAHRACLELRKLIDVDHREAA